MSNRILITGSAGMLGKDIAEILTALTGVHTYGILRSAEQTAPVHEKVVCDLTDPVHLEKVIREIHPDVIIHCAAIVNVDECEKNHPLADAVHVRATEVMSSFNAGVTRFIYISTDSVFNGSGGPYSESDSTDPVNYYALSKRNGEQAALNRNWNSAVLRTNIYGFHKPFSMSLGEWAIESLRTGKSINGFADVFFNPLYTKQVAAIVRDYFLKNGAEGIWHIGSDTPHSKYEFLKMLADRFGYDRTLVQSSSIEGIKFKTPRPKSTVLNTDKFRSIIRSPFTLSEGLDMYCTDIKSNFPE